MEKGVVELKCSKCNSGNIYSTLKERICRKCGFREELVLEKKK